MLTLLKRQLSISWGKLNNILIDHDYNRLVLNSIIEKKSTIFNWFLKLLNNIILQKYKLALGLNMIEKSNPTTELSL